MHLNQKKRKAQSMVEYAILLSVVISVFLLTQTVVKRSVSGNLNEAASKMGEQYSVSNTSALDIRMFAPAQAKQVTVDESGTLKAGGAMNSYLNAVGVNYQTKGTIDRGAHSYSGREGQGYITANFKQTDAAIEEKNKLAEYQAQAKQWDNFGEPY